VFKKRKYKDKNKYITRLGLLQTFHIYTRNNTMHCVTSLDNANMPSRVLGRLSAAFSCPGMSSISHNQRWWTGYTHRCSCSPCNPVRYSILNLNKYTVYILYMYVTLYTYGHNVQMYCE